LSRGISWGWSICWGWGISWSWSISWGRGIGWSWGWSIGWSWGRGIGGLGLSWEDSFTFVLDISNITVLISCVGDNLGT
jgi:hypothetical protein